MITLTRWQYTRDGKTTTPVSVAKGLDQKNALHPDMRYGLIGRICMEVPVQQIGRNVEGVITISGHLVFLGSFGADTILTHQTTDATMADVQTELFQLLRHSRPVVTAQAET